MLVDLSFASRLIGQQKKNSSEVIIRITHRDSFLTFLYEHCYFHTELSVISLNTAMNADVHPHSRLELLSWHDAWQVMYSKNVSESKWECSCLLGRGRGKWLLRVCSDLMYSMRLQTFIFLNNNLKTNLMSKFALTYKIHLWQQVLWCHFGLLCSVFQLWSA